MFNRSDGRGAIIWSSPEGETARDVFCCWHCNAQGLIDPGRSAADMGGWCYQCAKAICPSCTANGGCTPFMKTIERMEAEAYRKSQNERCL